VESRLKNDSRHSGSPREEDLAEAIVKKIMQAKKKLKLLFLPIAVKRVNKKVKVEHLVVIP